MSKINLAESENITIYQELFDNKNIFLKLSINNEDVEINFDKNNLLLKLNKNKLDEIVRLWLENKENYDEYFL